MAIDTDTEIEITDTNVSRTYVLFIVISLLIHFVILSIADMAPRFFSGEPHRNPSMEAIFIKLDDPPPRKKRFTPSCGSPESGIKQAIHPHEEIKSSPLPESVHKKPQKAAKNKPAPPKPKAFVKKAGSHPDAHADRKPAPAPSLKNPFGENPPGSASSGQEAEAHLASVAREPGISGQNSGNGGGAGGSFPAALGMNEVEQLPKIVKTIQPVYPLSARHLNIEGKITVKFLVSVTGEVMNPSIVSAEPEGIFDKNVLKAVAQWKFKPGMYQGKAVATWMMLPVRFKIN